jgi:hypothetical protein
MTYRGPKELLLDNAPLGGEANRSRHKRRKEVLNLLSSALNSVDDARFRLAELIPEAVAKGFVSPHQAAQINKATELWLKSETVAVRDYVRELEQEIDQLRREKILTARKVG